MSPHGDKGASGFPADDNPPFEFGQRERRCFRFDRPALRLRERPFAGREVFAYEVFLPGPDGDRYVYMSAIATADVRDELLPAFRDTALSFRWREAP